MISLKTTKEIEQIGAAGAILARLFEALPAQLRPGATTLDLDRFADAFIRDFPGAEPAFKGLYGFPGSVCISVNDEVVHGIPSKARVLEAGDLVSFDAGVRLEGWYADAAVTLPVVHTDAEGERLLEVTRESLNRGIAHALPGNHIGDIGYAVQHTAEEAGFGVVRDLVGHGVGRELHEEPQVPNVGRPGRGIKLQPGMVLAIEPMLNEGTARVRTLPDHWTVVTADRRRSAHFEHTVAIVENDGPLVLTGLPAT